METTSGHKVTSQRKIDANRRNARHSTGPKTVRGKKVVASNALKHGILVREIVPMQPFEDVKELEQLYADLLAEYDPLGRTEELLVQQIATSYWRLTRILRAETAALHQGHLDAGTQVVLDENNSFRMAYSKLTGIIADQANGKIDFTLSTCERLAAVQRVLLELQQTGRGVRLLKMQLDKIRSEIETEESVSETNGNLISSIFGLAGFDRDRFKDSEWRKVLIEMIVDWSAELEQSQRLLEARSVLGKDVALRKVSIPVDDRLEPRLRYEAQIERQLYRAMDRLDTLQRKRKGELVPPPLRVELNR